MNNINLYQGSGSMDQKKKKTVMAGSGLFLSIGILLIVALSYIGLRFVSKNLETKKTEMESEVEREIANFGGSDLDRIVDFQTRVSESIDNITEKLNTNKMLFAIEDSVVKGVSAVSLLCANGDSASPVISMGMMTGDFSAIARQVLSFKENKSFSNVYVEKMSRGEKGIEFTVKATFIK